MPLDLYVVGPGFGESVILKWTDGDTQKAGIVDIYGYSEGGPLIRFLEELDIECLSFVVLTHPHLDHLSGAAQVLRAFEGRVERFWWWGGLAFHTYVAFFDKLAHQRAAQDLELAPRAEALRNAFEEVTRQFSDSGLPERSDIAGGSRLYPAGNQTDGRLSAYSFSPWNNSLLSFTADVAQGCRPGASTEAYLHEADNRASIGVSLYYGNAHVVLGGDVETRNWRDLRSECVDWPESPPCVVKVSHHGSRTGQIAGMWSRQGFLVDSRHPPIAIATPCDRGRRKLPDPVLIRKLRKVCSDVYVTGQPIPGRKLKPWRSLVHVRVDHDGSAEVQEVSANVHRY